MKEFSFFTWHKPLKEIWALVDDNNNILRYKTGMNVYPTYPKALSSIKRHYSGDEVDELLKLGRIKIIQLVPKA